MDLKLTIQGLNAFVRDTRPPGTKKAAVTVLMALGSYVMDDTNPQKAAVPRHEPLLVIETQALPRDYKADATFQVEGKSYAMWRLSEHDVTIGSVDTASLTLSNAGEEAWTRVVHLGLIGPQGHNCGKADDAIVDDEFRRAPPYSNYLGARLRLNQGDLRAYVDPLYSGEQEFKTGDPVVLANAATLALNGVADVTITLRPWGLNPVERQIRVIRSGEGFFTNLPVTPEHSKHHFIAYWKLSKDGACKAYFDEPKPHHILFVTPVACPPVDLELP